MDVENGSIELAGIVKVVGADVTAFHVSMAAMANLRPGS